MHADQTHSSQGTHARFTLAYHGGNIAVDRKGLRRLVLAVHGFVQVDGSVREPLVPHPILVPGNGLIAGYEYSNFS